ncbi:MAG TPA: hypothetical protein DCQ26_18150 [Marinilabiliales bacterium]|nr:MAG: hypothetical protein A2W95_06945 [Bacteroidetes bacterium GWA2_40_14]OFX61563.1 MAG: hypothetical protein A2W84_10065 [Bacteroidetes bacterium GWC2_40_13]OFX73561.1 MAG: hypothetical protein A2W96_02740 [Bacteroidetes bacterium GWD2_40_43]OFX90764.1 MAG: hypothetical protein A2W97_03300 [Bacteroidetes bacterium GWE2_40_63]OFY20604.1 MAG: hypothetical protein A2W88_13535 [Bacteroidetes bacterium GWF2_40_13]OFZ24681.1 MAG: hypothetical protein A2437_03765 [Bacteroidetes bacterium RIFOXYC
MKKINLRINGKMLVYILGTTIIVSIFSLGFIATGLKGSSEENSRKILDGLSVALVQSTAKVLSQPSQSANVLAVALAKYEFIPAQDRTGVFNAMLSDVLLRNPNYYSVWTICEPNTIEPIEGSQTNGFQPGSMNGFRFIAIRENGQIKMVEQQNQEPYNEIYRQVKNNLQEMVFEPKTISARHHPNDSIVIMEIALPVVSNYQFIGVVGIQLSLNEFRSAFAKQTTVNSSKLFVLTQQGKLISHTDSTVWGMSFVSYAPKIEKAHHVSENALKREMPTFIAKDPISGLKSLYKIQPIQVGSGQTYWAVGLSVPLSDLYYSGNRTFLFSLFIGIIAVVLISVIIMGIASSISNPLSKATKQLQLIAKGEIKSIEHINSSIKDEISDMALAMEELSVGLQSATQFAQEIGKGKLDAEYQLLSENDLLGNSLLSMQASLKNAKLEEEKKRVEDEKRNWVTHGLASFGEIIRQHNDNMEAFTMNVTQNLIDYVDAAQGAMYINQQLENDFTQQEEFEMKAAIAYGKPVMMQKSVISGQELVGRAIEENRTILLEQLPERYVLLSPGMQDKARPQNLLIVPITINDNCLGVFELLSYKKFEPHHLEFIEKLSENIASVISSVKTNLRTAKLLQQSQYQADEMAQHEEEMRQNLEEMQATQEESAKREENLNTYIKAIKSRMMLAELDMDSRIIDISPSMSTTYTAHIENLRGKFYDALVTHDNDSKNEFTEFWSQMIHQGSGRRRQVITNRGKELILFESYKVIPRDKMAPIVLVFVADHSKEKELEDLLEAEIKSAEKSGHL